MSEKFSIQVDGKSIELRPILREHRTRLLKSLGEVKENPLILEKTRVEIFLELTGMSKEEFNKLDLVESENCIQKLEGIIIGRDSDFLSRLKNQPDSLNQQTIPKS